MLPIQYNTGRYNASNRQRQNRYPHLLDNSLNCEDANLSQFLLEEGIELPSFNASNASIYENMNLSQYATEPELEPPNCNAFYISPEDTGGPPRTIEGIQGFDEDYSQFDVNQSLIQDENLSYLVDEESFELPSFSTRMRYGSYSSEPLASSPIDEGHFPRFILDIPPIQEMDLSQYLEEENIDLPSFSTPFDNPFQDEIVDQNSSEFEDQLQKEVRRRETSQILNELEQDIYEDILNNSATMNELNLSQYLNDEQIDLPSFSEAFDVLPSVTEMDDNVFETQTAISGSKNAVIDSRSPISPHLLSRTSLIALTVTRERPNSPVPIFPVLTDDTQYAMSTESSHARPRAPEVPQLSPKHVSFQSSETSPVSQIYQESIPNALVEDSQFQQPTQRDYPLPSRKLLTKTLPTRRKQKKTLVRGQPPTVKTLTPRAAAMPAAPRTQQTPIRTQPASLRTKPAVIRSQQTTVRARPIPARKNPAIANTQPTSGRSMPPSLPPTRKSLAPPRKVATGTPLLPPESMRAPPRRTLVAPGETLPTSGREPPILARTLPIPGRTLPTPGRTLPTPGRTLPTPGRTLPTPGRTLPTSGRTLPTPVRTITEPRGIPTPGKPGTSRIGRGLPRYTPARR